MHTEYNGVCWKSQDISRGIRGLEKTNCNYGNGIAQEVPLFLPFDVRKRPFNAQNRPFAAAKPAFRVADGSNQAEKWRDQLSGGTRPRGRLSPRALPLGPHEYCRMRV